MQRRRVAVVGAGISGLTAAYELAKAGVEVAIYEKAEYMGDHSRAVNVDGVDIDLGFIVFNPILCRNMTESFKKLDVEMEAIDLSFSISKQDENYEWGSRNGLRSLFAQKANIVNPFVWYMLKEIFNFKNDAIRYLNEHDENPNLDRNETLDAYLKSHEYSQLFQNAYLIPICASIWSCHLEEVWNFSAYNVLSFCLNHHLTELSQPQWLTARCFQQNYVDKVREELEERCCQIKLGCVVQTVSRTEKGWSVIATGALEELYDECLITIHASEALSILGKQATYEESRILGAFQYVHSDVYLHCDGSLMPQNPSAWSARNFLGKNNINYLTYWLNVLQNLGPATRTLLVTLNPPFVPKKKILKWTTSYPLPTIEASRAALELEKIQGKRGIWFCGSYQGYGFQEDELKAGLVIARNMHGMDINLLKNTRHMAPSLMEKGARLVVSKFLERYITTGCLM